MIHMDLHNTKLILSCLKQTPTLRMVTPTSTSMPEEADRAKEALAANAVVIAMVIAETTQSLIISLKEN